MTWVALGSAAITAAGQVASAPVGGGMAGFMGGGPSSGSSGLSLGNDGWIVNLRGMQVGATASPTDVANADPMTGGLVGGLGTLQGAGLPLLLFGGAAVILLLKKGRKS